MYLGGVETPPKFGSELPGPKGPGFGSLDETGLSGDTMTFLEKQEKLKALFRDCPDASARTAKLIDLGRAQPPLPPENKTPANRVHGCQSTMYLTTRLEEGLVYFAGEADALVSNGLAALLILVYSGEMPETILKCPPTYLEEIGLRSSLSLNRLNGLESILLRMKQEALKMVIGHGLRHG